jgi:hypothetical protein
MVQCDADSAAFAMESRGRVDAPFPPQTQFEFLLCAPVCSLTFCSAAAAAATRALSFSSSAALDASAPLAAGATAAAAAGPPGGAGAAADCSAGCAAWTCFVKAASSSLRAFVPYIIITIEN